jgi:hypothetical protein
MKQSAIAAMIERDLLRRDTEKGRVETETLVLILLLSLPSEKLEHALAR